MEIVTKEKGKKTIPEGFKQTELGLYPENWEIFKIIEIADDNTNWSFTGGPFGSDLKTEHYTEKGIRVIQLQNIGDGRFLNGSKVFTTKGKADELISANIYPGEIILSKMGDPVARACIVPDLHDRYLMCSDGIRLKVDSSRFDKTYIHTYINYKDFRSRAKNASSGSTRKRIGLKNLKQLKVVVPPLEEQQAIAESLSDVDSLIGELDVLIEKKQQIKKGAMQQLLTGTKRLPGFDGEWEKKTFDECFHFLKTGTNSRSDLSDNGGVGYIHYGDIHAKWTGVLNCDEDSIPSIQEKKVTRLPRLEEGDLILADASEDYEGVGAGIEVKNLNGRQVVAGLHTILLRAKDGCIADGYKAYITSTKKVKRSLREIATGTTVYGISKSKLKQVSISLPPTSEEQEAIAEILNDIEAQIKTIQAKREKYQKIKQGMMQELLTGKTRLV